jgi:WD40 repeat protein
LAFAPDSRLLATASDDMSVRLWDPSTGKEQFVLRGHVDGISALAFAPDGGFLVTSSHDGSIKRWDLAAVRETNILTGNGGWILGLAFSPDGTQLAAASTGKGGANITFAGEVKLWDVASGQESATLPAEGWAVSEVEFSPDGSTLATCTEAAHNALVTLWDVSTRQVKAKWPTRRGSALRFLSDGKTLATCDRQSRDGIQLWDLATRQERAVLKANNSNRCLALAPDGITLAAGDWNKSQVELWNMSTEKPVRALGTGWNEGWVSSFHDFMGNSSVSFSADGRTVASAGRTAGIIGRGTIRVLDVASGRERLSLKGHKAEVWSVAFARDGKTLVSGSDDHTIKFWDPVSGDQRLTLRGHEARISTVAFSPDGTTLATASWDGTVRLWRAAARNEVELRSEPGSRHK